MAVFEIKCLHTFNFLVQKGAAYAGAFTMLCLPARSQRNRTATIVRFYVLLKNKIALTFHSSPFHTVVSPENKVRFLRLDLTLGPPAFFPQRDAAVGDGSRFDCFCSMFSYLIITLRRLQGLSSQTVSLLPPECSECCLSVCLSVLIELS